MNQTSVQPPSNQVLQAVMSRHMDALVSPKQPPQEHLKEWYPYYAGYTEVFAKGVFDRYFQSAQSIVDPWNGSGTTTAIAASRGIRSFGVDVNPVQTIVARARLTPRSIADSLIPIADEIVLRALSQEPGDRDVEPLSEWLLAPAVRDIRKLQRSIHIVTSADAPLELELARADPEASARLPLVTAFFYAALFAACRDLLRPFRGTNPTWLKAPEARHRLRPSEKKIHAAFVDRVKYLSARLMVDRSDVADLSTIRTGVADDLLEKGARFDACLTSPPYATRIDYVRSAIPELSVLGLSPSSIAALRRQATGTPVVRGVASPDTRLPTVASELVAGIASHGSHGSANYYAPWLKNYLSQLHGTLGAISASVNPSGRIALVVQDSYYKSIHIDLQAIVQASLAEFSRELVGRHDFEVTRSMSFMNTRARGHLPTRMHRETLLVFE